MKRCLRLLLCTSLLWTAVGCTNVHPTSVLPPEGPAQDVVELEWYVNFSWYNTPWGGNAVSEAITAATGASVEFISPSGSETETLDALIASDSLPDLVTLGWWEPQFGEILEKGLAYSLNDLADQYAPNFWKAADPDRIQWYTQPDGNVYCYPNSSYTPKDYEGEKQIGSNQTFLVRKDIYEALGCPDMTTPEGFAAAVRAAAEQFPTVDGLPLIPVGAHEFTERGCDSFDNFLLNFLAIPYEKDGKAYDRYTDPEYKAWLSMFRQLGEEGLLSSEIFIDKRAQMEEKIAVGRYFCMIYQRTDMVEQQRYLSAHTPERIYLAVDGPRNSNGDAHTLPGTGINGWTVTLISKNCRDPERAIQLMTFMMSEEGQKLIALGVEGKNYTMENGRAVLTPETKALLERDYQEYLLQVGANDAYWMLQDNRMQDLWEPLEEPAVRQMEEWTYPYTCYTGQYDPVFRAGSAAEQADAALTAIHSEMLPQLLLAPDQESFDALWESYVERREESGLELWLAEKTRQMEDAKKKLGME